MSFYFLAMFDYAPPSFSISYQRLVGALKDIANKVAVPSFHCLPANEAKVIHVTNTLERKDQAVKPFRIVLKVTHKHKHKIMWKKGSTSHLWAKGDFSETLLYGNFLSVWTDQEDLRPAHLKQRQTQKVRLCKCLCVCFHRLAVHCVCLCYDFWCVCDSNNGPQRLN